MTTHCRGSHTHSRIRRDTTGDKEERKAQFLPSLGFCGIVTATICSVENSSTGVAEADVSCTLITEHPFNKPGPAAVLILRPWLFHDSLRATLQGCLQKQQVYTVTKWIRATLQLSPDVASWLVPGWAPDRGFAISSWGGLRTKEALPPPTGRGSFPNFIDSKMHVFICEYH